MQKKPLKKLQRHQQRPLHQRRGLLAQARGRQGELLALKHLQRNGYSILEQNWHKRWAEIDLVARDGDTLVFIEVKTRYSHHRGKPEESITPQKLSALTRSAQIYKMEHPDLPEALRIDFIGIDYAEQNPPRIVLIKNITL